ncbi:MAG: hypothetical protein IJE65_00915 [Clostridia bacterium]|nr:hypothetical protein [Clostridia bacterium]
MIDTHSHILPKLDDGSRNIDESIAILKILKEQGITHVIATPHFKMTDKSNSIDEFIIKRNESYQNLKNEIDKQGLDLPKIILGAEVLLTMDFVEAEDKEKLCIENTNIMLIELPYYEWQSWMLRMLRDLCNDNDIEPIIAHADRYVDFISNDMFEKLFSLGYKTQVNAEFVNDKTRVKRLKKWLKSGQICYIGSDTHGIDFRPPTFDNYFNKIKKTAGDAFIQNVSKHSTELIKKLENNLG